MAPVDNPDHNLVEQQIKDVIQDLFQVMVQVNTYDQAGVPSRDVLTSGLTTLDDSLRTVHRTASSSLPQPSDPRFPPNQQASQDQGGTPAVNLPYIPDTLIEYVDAGRNPDIYTREFVELVRRMNQLARGKQTAFVQFRDVLAEEMGRAMPELRGDVDRVLEATGGRTPMTLVVTEGRKDEEGMGS